MRHASIALIAGMVCWFLALQVPAANAGTEQVLYSFCANKNCTDGEYPFAAVTDVNGTLYGTADLGGANGQGEVFAINLGTGAMTIIYSFCSQPKCADGANPYMGGLVDVNGTLYGTTADGGSKGGGTIFSINESTGAETVLYSFCSQRFCADGESPASGLIAVNGILYGTTQLGGTRGTTTSRDGTIFAFDLSKGTESVLYSFCSQQNCADGSDPTGGLIAVNNTLYGTTTLGGANKLGTVFAVDAGTGAESVLYSFCSQQNCADGREPTGSLTIDSNGMLYGTTQLGGSTNCTFVNPPGCGVAFSVNPNTGDEAVLYTFCDAGRCLDGAYPVAGMIDVNGTLYGTTFEGGANCTGNNPPGCGTVFSLDPNSGAETVLYSFNTQPTGADGIYPFAGVIDVNGTLYGTTQLGGTHFSGAVFSLTTPKARHKSMATAGAPR